MNQRANATAAAAASPERCERMLASLPSPLLLHPSLPSFSSFSSITPSVLFSSSLTDAYPSHTPAAIHSHSTSLWQILPFLSLFLPAAIHHDFFYLSRRLILLTLFAVHPAVLQALARPLSFCFKRCGKKKERGEKACLEEEVREEAWRRRVKKK